MRMSEFYGLADLILDPAKSLTDAAKLSPKASLMEHYARVMSKEFNESQRGAVMQVP